MHLAEFFMWHMCHLSQCHLVFQIDQFLKFLSLLQYLRTIFENWLSVSKMQNNTICDDVQAVIWEQCSLSGYGVCKSAHELCSKDFWLVLHSFMTWRMLSHINKPIVRRIAHEQMDRFENKFKLLVLPQKRKYGTIYIKALEATRVPCLLFHSTWGMAVRLRRYQL